MLATTPPAERGGIVRVAMNARGDVAYQTGAGLIIVVPHATGQAMVVAGPERDLRRVRSLVMDENGAVAWIDRRRGLWHWDASHGRREVDSRVSPERRLDRSAVALDATRGLVYVDYDYVFRWDPATGSETILLDRTSPPGDLQFVGFFGSVSFTTDGVAVRTIVQRASTGDMRWRYVCITSEVATCESAGYVDAGARVLASANAALLASQKQRLSVVVRPGDVIPVAGTIRAVEAHVVDGASIVFAARLSDDTVAIARWRDGVVTDIPRPATGSCSTPTAGPSSSFRRVAAPRSHGSTPTATFSRPAPSRRPTPSRQRSSTDVASSFTTTARWICSRRVETSSCRCSSPALQAPNVLHRSTSWHVRGPESCSVARRASGSASGKWSAGARAGSALSMPASINWP